MRIFNKQPAEVLDYDLDLASWMPEGDYVTAAVTTTEAGITADSTSFTATAVKIWLSGGVSAQAYKITCHITTNDGRVKEVDFRVYVNDI